jgi:putative hydrolase of HD superfamily
MDTDRFKKQLDFIIEIDKVKQVLRNTVLMDASRRENDAEHMWHMAVGAMVLSEYSDSKELNMLKVFKIIMLHDVVEIYAGDTFAYDDQGYLDKAEREGKAADKIFGMLPEDQGIEFRSLWDEFEEGITPEAKFAGAMDHFMPILHNYSTQGLQWQRMGISSDRVLTKNKNIEKGSKFLWDYIKCIVADGVKKGYLKE